MPTTPFPVRSNIDTQQIFNRCFELVGGVNPDELGSLRVSVAGITIPPLAIALDCAGDSVQICADNGTTVEGILSNANNHLIVAPAPPIRTVETSQAIAGELSFTSAAEADSYNVVFVGMSRTISTEDFEFDLSVKRGAILHPIFKSSKFKDFVTITDNIKLSSGEVLVATTTGVGASTIDLTVIKETV